ncbi:MAG: adenylate/guanylate cyclase domain-containing protein [Bacteroidota bacterium]
MKKLLFIICLIPFLIINGFAQQQSSIDTILSELKKYESAKVASGNTQLSAIDTAKVNLLLVVSEKYRMEGDYKKADVYGKEALTISKAINYKKGTGNAYVNLANIYNEQAKYPLAISNFNDAINAYQEVGNKKEMANLYSKIGVINFNQSNFDEALKNFKTSLKYAEEIHDYYLISGCYGNLGRINKLMGNYAEALSDFQNALKSAEEIGAKGGISSIYKNIGQISSEQETMQEGLKSQITNLKREMEFQKQLTGEQLIQQKQKLEINQKELALINKEKDLEKVNHLKTQAELNEEKLVNEKQVALNEKNAFQLKLAEADALSNQHQRNYFIAGTILFILLSFFIYLNYINQRKSNKLITKEKERSDELLLNILPYDVAEELKTTGTAKAKNFESATVMFTDFKDFTRIGESLTPDKLVAEIDYCFSSFDEIIQKYGIEKIKTIGDAYMCVGGLPTINDTHAEDIIHAGLEIRDFIENYKKEKVLKGEIPFEIRIGINTGPVVAGIVGLKKFAYDIWGDTVNLAARMESGGEAGKVNISGTTYNLVKDKFNCTYRGKIQAKNRGEVDMYFVEAKG